MTENEIQLLGFKKQIITDAESGNGYDFHFYTYNIATNLTFVSCASDEAECDDFAIENWNIKIDGTVPLIEFHNFGEMQSLINLLENKIKQRR